MQFIKITLISSVIITLFLSFFVFYILWYFSPQLPTYDKIINYKPNLSSRIYSSDGKLLKSFYVEERIFVPVERIPNRIKEAFISAEDKKFYNHYGIDIVAIFRAIFTNTLNFSSNKRVVGASTITQQVVKNLLLTNEISYERKIKEILLAIRIENLLTKNQILELYLNDIYLGYGSYGIASASLNYFNKSIYELGLHEIAFLAALPKAPNNYNPKKNYKSALQRRNWVIDRMYSNKFIQKNDLVYKKKPIEVFRRIEDKFQQGEYYYEEIRKELYDNYGMNKLYSEGLIIKTSIDSEIQKLAENSLTEGLLSYQKKQGWDGILTNSTKDKFIENINSIEKINPYNDKWFPVLINDISETKELTTYDINYKKHNIDLNIEENKWLKKILFNKGDVIFLENIEGKNVIRQTPQVNGAIVVIDPHNGNVLAMSGGFSFKLSEFNRATQAKRQPGSAFKPFVYMAALNEGYTPSTLILDAPYVVDQGPGLPKWKPANYTDEFYGLTTMRTGIEKSRNLMTVRLADRIGMGKIIDLIKKFGIEDGISSQLSMSLGSGQVSLLELTNAYAIIANGGNKIIPNIINSIYSKDGKIIYNSDNKHCQKCKMNTIHNKLEIPKIIKKYDKVIDEKIAYQITSMMEGVIKRGTAKNLKELNISLAGKTGTTNDNKDAWFIGFTPNMVIGIYVGYDMPKSLGYKQTGSSVAVPIFNNFAKKIDLNSNNIPFRVPSGISFVRIDPNSGLPSTNDMSILEPYIIGSEPYNKKIDVLDNLGTIKNNTISGTGGLLQ